MLQSYYFFRIFYLLSNFVENRFLFMHIIKLHAIHSTNLYLKNLTLIESVKNFTVVVAEHQTSGRGQMGTVWESDKGKNLTFSMLISLKDFQVNNQFFLSMAIALAVLEVVKLYTKISVKIKWPNDILADKRKLAGILIENNLKGSFIKSSIVGIGLNVHQTNFPKTIENATSIKQLTGIEIDKEILLERLIQAIKKYVQFIDRNDFKTLKELYLKNLYQLNTPTMFEDSKGVVFLGKIRTVSEEGMLVVELDNETTRQFSLKEIKFASC